MYKILCRNFMPALWNGEPVVTSIVHDYDAIHDKIKPVDGPHQVTSIRLSMCPSCGSVVWCGYGCASRAQMKKAYYEPQQ